MLSVVAFHCSQAVLDILKVGSPGFVMYFDDCLKFGTVAFFLVSGFLLGSRFDSVSRFEFMGKRLRRVFLPWCLWFSIQVVYDIFGRTLNHGAHFGFDLDTLLFVGRMAESAAFTTAFWFVPNLLLATFTLLLFRRFLRSPWFGFCLLAVTAFYTFNIYGQWLPTGHTVALFGYVFYLWLGAYLAQTNPWLTRFVSRLSMRFLILLALGSCIAALAETALLAHWAAAAVNNSLRFTNQIFSIAVVLLLMKLPGKATPAFVDVRRNMFGVYLSHILVVSILQTAAFRLFSHFALLRNVRGNFAFLVLWAFATAAVFFISLGITKFCASRPALVWMVGDLAPAPPAPVPSSARSVAQSAPGSFQETQVPVRHVRSA